MMAWLRALFTPSLSDSDRERYGRTERELAQVRGEFHNTVQTAKSSANRLKLMEQTLALKGKYDGPSDF